MITPKTIQQRDEDWIAGRQSGEASRKDRHDYRITQI